LRVPGLAQYALLCVNVEDDALVMSCGGSAGKLEVLPGIDQFPEVLRSAMREGRKTELGLRPSGRLPEQVRFVQIFPLKSGVRTVATLVLGHAQAPGAHAAADQVTHLAQLVDDLLDVSRITQGKISLKKEPVELGKVVQHSVETARTLLDAKRHTLLVNLPSTPIWVHGDFARLAQVVGNLLNNG